MKKLKSLMLVITTSLCISSAMAQSSWIGALPMQYNPSFAGSSGGPRIVGLTSYVSSKYFNLSTDNPKIWRNYGLALSYDTYIPSIHSGVGFTFHYSDSRFIDTVNNTKTYTSGLSWSPKISIKGKYTIAPSINIIYRYSDNPFPPVYYSHYPNRLHNGFQYKAGLLFNSAKFYAGISLNSRGQNYSSDHGTESFTYPLHFVVSAGYSFQRKPESRFSFTPQIMYMRDFSRHYSPYTHKYYSRTLSLMNLNFRYRKIIWGVGWNAYSGFSLMAGYQTDKFKITLTSIPGSYRNTFELSFRYNIGKKSTPKNIW